ncbi:MAG TPA: carboxypeptidase regulatory-like domain-containing protein [Chryseolinea sp.]|nr:carboxypeptidase regulatory-like domain-containing protein [Chryseolinea sp.]
MKKNYLLKIIFLILLTDVPFQMALAQGSIVEGTVVEQQEQQPIEFSTVSIFSANDSALVTGVLSDLHGQFRLTQLQKGKYYAVVQFLGYETKKISDINLAPNQKISLGTIVLTPHQELLDEITVTGEKASAYHQIDKQVYNASQFQTSQGGNAIEVLRNLPSLSVNSEGEITLRGSTGFIVMLDGKAMQADPLVILNQLPANTIDNIEVMTTPSSKFDPDGKAGIINITTKKGATDGYYLLANVQGGLPSIEDYGNENAPVRFGGDITANIKQGKVNYSLSANYKRDDIAGVRDGEAETTIGNTFTTSPSKGERSYRSYSYGVRGVINYEVNKANILAVGFYAGKKSQFRKADLLYNQQRFNLSNSEEINSLDYFNKNLRERKGDFVVANVDYTHLLANKGSISFSALYEKTILGGPTSNTDVNPENHAEVYNDADMQESNPLDGVRVKTDYTFGQERQIRGRLSIPLSVARRRFCL